METNMNQRDDTQISLLDLIYAIVYKKKFVIYFTCFFAIIAIIYSLVTPKKWISKTTIQPIAENASGISLDSGLLDMLGGGILPNSQSDMGQQFVAIMESRTFREEIVRKYDLVHYYKITKPDTLAALEMAVKKMTSSMVSIGLDPKINIITIAIETKDKSLSKDIAQYYINKLDHYNRHVKLTKSSMKRAFLERNVSEVRAQIDTLSVEVRDFQKKYRAIAPDQQTQALIGIYSDAISELMKTEMTLEMSRQTLSPGSPQLATLQKQKELMEERLKDLESKHSEMSPKYLLQIDKIPDLTLRFAHLQMNLEIQKKIFEYLYPQYEAAKIDELRDMPTMEIIDSPNLAGMRSKPKRAQLVVLVTLAAFLLASVISMIMVYMSNSQRSVFQKILSELSLRRKE